MADRQLENLKKQKAYAWGKYYEQMGNDANNAIVLVQYANVAHAPAAQRPADIPTHITDELYTMACELRRKFECPCCLEMVSKETIQITHCGHIYDKDCLAILKAQADPKCAVCRRKI
jgi:hypothetical protein